MDRAPASRPIPALDGIRGLAIIWVVLHNTMDRPLAPAGGVLHVLAALAHLGWIGVQLFFALSGFLITSGLLSSQGNRHYFRNFYAKRALRILPLYYTVLFVLLVVLPRVVTLHPPLLVEQQAPLWLFTLNWTQSSPYGFGHFWSLAVEEQFYLFWPLIVWRLPPRRLLNVCVWIAAGALLVRCILAAHGADWWTLYANTACRMDALALGGAGACVLRIPEMRDQLRTRSLTISALALVFFLAGMPLTHFYDRESWAGQTLGYTILALCSAAFVTAVAMLPFDRARAGILAPLSWPLLRSCGRYSYAMYVFHGLLHKWLGEPWLVTTFGEHPSVQVGFAYALVILIASYLLGFCSYYALEQPFLQLKGRLNGH